MVHQTESRSRIPGGEFVDPQVLARIGNLELVARTVVEGFITGLHKSPFLGFSVDFAEHRQYVAGDDIRRIDWRVWGRTDRYYVKEYEADTNTDFVVLFDVSSSMDYGTKGLSKFDYGRFLAASLTYFSHKQRDRVGLVTFDDDIVDYVPPSAKHMQIVLHRLDAARAGAKGSLTKPMAKVAELLGRRGIVVIVSDFYEEVDTVVRALSQLQFRGNDVVAFHLLDPAERALKHRKSVYFQDMESGEEMPVVPEKVREAYEERVGAHVEELGRRLRALQMDYTMLDTTTPLDFALFEYLSERQRFSRVR
ncbi:DUF58 domain-containing protein [Gemmatimonadota bacterium]